MTHAEIVSWYCKRLIRNGVSQYALPSPVTYRADGSLNSRSHHPLFFDPELLAKGLGAHAFEPVNGVYRWITVYDLMCELDRNRRSSGGQDPVEFLHEYLSSLDEADKAAEAEARKKEKKIHLAEGAI